MLFFIIAQSRPRRVSGRVSDDLEREPTAQFILLPANRDRPTVTPRHASHHCTLRDRERHRVGQTQIALHSLTSHWPRLISHLATMDVATTSGKASRYNTIICS